MQLLRTLWPILGLSYQAPFAAGAKLLTGGTIVAFDRASGLFDVIRNGSLLVEGGQITLISESALPKGVSDDTELVDCTNKIITPGFIDTHRHGWQTAYKTLGSNTTLAEYRRRYSALVGYSLFTPDDLYISQLAGIYEAQAAGVTTILDHAHHTWTREHAAAGWKASVDSHARIFFAYAFMNTTTGFQVPEQMAHWRELAASSPANLSTLSIAYDYFTDNPEFITKSVVDLAKYVMRFYSRGTLIL
jgi:cytosine/adenosine deaminase-related metal-dependent hydrolase